MIDSFDFFSSFPLGSLSGSFSCLFEYMAFDFSTSLAVSDFGYALNASFVKKPKSPLPIFKKVAPRKLAKSIFNGAKILESFKALVNWLIAHSFDVLVAGFVAFTAIILFRYLARHLGYKLTTKKN